MVCFRPKPIGMLSASKPSAGSKVGNSAGVVGLDGWQLGWKCWFCLPRNWNRKVRVPGLNRVHRLCLSHAFAGMSGSSSRGHTPIKLACVGAQCGAQCRTIQANLCWPRSFLCHQGDIDGLRQTQTSRVRTVENVRPCCTRDSRGACGRLNQRAKRARVFAKVGRGHCSELLIHSLHTPLHSGVGTFAKGKQRLFF